MGWMGSPLCWGHLRFTSLLHNFTTTLTPETWCTNPLFVFSRPPQHLKSMLLTHHMSTTTQNPLNGVRSSHLSNIVCCCKECYYNIKPRLIGKSCLWQNFCKILRCLRTLRGFRGLIKAFWHEAMRLCKKDIHI